MSFVFRAQKLRHARPGSNKEAVATRLSRRTSRSPNDPPRGGGASTTAKASQEEVDTPFKIIHEVMKAGLDDKIWLEMIDKDKQEKDLADKGYSQVDVSGGAEALPDRAKGKLGVEIYCSMSVRVFLSKSIEHRSQGNAKTWKRRTSRTPKKSGRTSTTAKASKIASMAF